MFEKVAVFEKRYEEIEQLLCQPQTVQDPARYTALLRESSEMAPLVQEYRRYRQAVQREEQARDLLKEPGLDKELETLAQEELAAGRAEQAERLWKSGRAPVGKKRPCFRRYCFACTACMPKKRDGLAK